MAGKLLVGIFGSCYDRISFRGGWVLTRALADPETSMLTFAAIGCPHIKNIADMLDEPLDDVLTKIRGPLLFLPARDDSMDYK